MAHNRSLYVNFIGVSSKFTMRPIALYKTKPLKRSVWIPCMCLNERNLYVSLCGKTSVTRNPILYIAEMVKPKKRDVKMLNVQYFF